MANFLNWLKDNLAKANNLDTNINNYEGTSANNVGNSAKATKTETKKAQKVSSGTSVSAGESLVQQAQPTKATQTKANNDVTFADGSKTQDLDNSQNFSEYVVKTLSNAKEKAKTTVKDVLSESYAKVPNYSDSDVDGILNTLKTNGYKTSTQDMEKAYNYITSVNPNQNHGDKYEEVKDLYKAINKIQEDEDVDSKAYSDVELDKDAQGNYIFDYSDQLQELYDLKEKNRTGEIRLTKEQVEDYKKQLKNVERKQEKANDIYITANKDQFLTNLDSQDKINTLKTYSSRNDNQIERVGNVTGKVANEIVATPWKLDKAIKSLNQDTAKNVATFNYANGLISKEEYDEMMSKNSIDLDDQELMVNRMQDRINLLNSQAYYGLTENQTLALNVVESMENNYFNQFLFGKYMTAAMSVESATDKVNTLIAQGYDPAMAFANGIITGVFSAYTESDRFARTFERAADYLPGYALGDYFGNFATAFLNGAFGESVEEAAEWFVEPILDAATLGTPIEYNFGDLGRTIIVAGLSGGLQSGTSSINYSISTDKQANTIENEIKHLYKNIDAYTDTGKELVKRIANNGQLALNNYDASRVLPRGALVTESNQGETFLNYQEAMSRLDEMVKPDIENRQEAINSLQQSIESLKAVSQQVLNDNGIYFANGINEYYQVTDQGKQNIKNIQPVVNAAQEKGTQVVYTTQDKVTIDGKEYNVEQGVNFGDGLIIINPNKANVEGVVRHEIFHSFSRYEQSKLENIIKQTFGVDYWNNTNQQVKDVYDDSSIWNEETNAALIENAFGNQKFLQNLKNQDASLFKKAKDLVSYYVNKGILDAKYNSIFENAELLGNAAYSKEVYDDSVIKDPNNPKYYNYNNLIKLDDIDSVSVVVSKHYKIYKGNVNDIFNTMKNNYPSGVNGNQINVENIKTNEKFEITDKIVSHTSFNMNNRENVVALENLPILLETATPMMKSFETLNKNNNFTSYYNLFEYNDKPYIVRIITKDGVIDSLGTISPSVAYALNSNKKGSTPTSANRFKNVSGRTRSAFTISINNLIKEINNDKRFYVDLSQNTRARLGLNNQKEFGKYTNKYSKPLEVSSKEDSDGDKVSKGMLDYMKGTKLTKDGALMKIYHTGKSLFEVFDPTNTIGYRFGPNVVNYYSNNQNVSGSYTNGEYKQINKANYEENEKAIDNYRTKQDEWNKAFKTYDDNKNLVGRKMFDYINNYRELFNGMDDILYEAAYGENKLDLNAYDQIMLEDYRDNIRQFLSSDTPSKAFSNGSYLTKLIDSYNNSVGKNTVSKEFVDLFNNNKNYVEMINEMKQYYDANNELYNDYQNINKELENYRKIVEGGNQYVGYGLAKNPYVINGNNTNWNEINNSDYWLDVDTMNKVGSDFIEMVNKEEENGDRDVYDILLSRKKKYKAEEFIINNMPNDSKQFLIDNPIVLANLTNIFYNPYTNIENEVGYQFNRNVGVKQVDDVQKPIMKFGDKLETNDVVRAVLTINQYLKDNGQDTKYDGVVFESIRDSGSGVEGSYEPSDIIALFNSNQFKLIDNENPTIDKRIRYAKNLDNQGAKINPNMQEFLKDSVGDREDPYDINSPHMRWKHGTYKGDFTQFLGKGDTRTYFDWERGKYEQETSKNGAIYLTASPEMAWSYSHSNETINPYEFQKTNTLKDVNEILNKDNVSLKKYKEGYYIVGKEKELATYLEPNAEMDSYYGVIDAMELAPGQNEDVDNFDYQNALYRIYIAETFEQAKTSLINENGLLRGNYNLYAKSENPYIIDAKGKKWYEIVIPTEMLNSGDMRDWYNEGNYVDTRTIENWFYENLYGKGYDSIRIQNVIDNGQFSGQIEPSDILIVFDSANVKDINNQNPTSNKDIRYSKPLEISDEDLSKFVKGKKLSDKTLATIQKYKTELADNAQDWIPNYDIIARRYPSFSKENLSTALFEIFENGNLSEETKNALRDNIIATEFYGNKEQYLNSKRTNEVNNLINDAIDYFSVDAKYQANQSELDKTANRANQYIKAYSGIDASQDIEQKFDDIKQMQDMEKRIKDAREKTSKSYVKTLQDMVTLAKDKISRWKTLEQNLDVMAGGALELRKGMQEVFELPKYQAQTTNAALLTEGDKYIQEKVKQGFREGSKESKATQWHLEGHTDELVELSQVEDPRTLSDQDSNKKVYKPFTEEDLKFQFNYKMSNGKYAYENIIEYAKELRERYDDLHYQINSTRINQIYGDIEGKNDLETTKLLAKVNTQNEVVKQLANRMVKEKPSVELQSAYNQAKQEFNKLANQYNKKIEKNQSNDSTRRQLVPYRQNYAPHVIEKGNFLQQLRNAINSENKTPTDLAGISDYAKPRSTFAGFMMAQEGGNYTADATAGFAQYIKEASRVIAYDPLVDYYRNIAKDLRDLTKGITLNDFDEYLNDYTNSLAGKTNEFDRGGKKMFGTKALKVVDVLNKRAKANSLMFNFRTMVVQAANLPNAMSVLQGNGGAKVTQDIARGTYNYLSNITNENALDKQSPFLTMRYADIDTGDLSFKAKAEKVANFMMEKVDEISTKAIWYSAYEQGVRKGVDDAIFYADDLTRRSVAGRDVGEVPLALQSKFINLAMPFQVETQNVWNTMGGLLKDKKFGAILTSLIAGWLMNNLYEKLFGDRPIFDPIDAIKDGIKASEGGEYQNLVTRLAGEVIGANPIATSAVSFALDEDQREKLFGEQDPTKYGTTNISVQALGKAIVQAYESKNLKSLETLLYAYGLPGGGTQAKRIVQTLQTYGILPQQVDGEWLSEPISYTDSGKIRYANDTEINAENVLDFMKQLAFGTWAGKQGQAYLEDGKYLSDSQSNIFDAFNSGLSAYQSYSLTKEYANIESLKDENGKTITNSEGLQKRALLQENGVWEDYKENNEAGKNNIGKTVYNMTNDEFQKAYEEVFGKAVEQPQETKETKNVGQEQSSLKDIFSGLFNKDEAEETPKETNIDNMESSTSGNLYPNGKKPTQEDYLNGLENFYEEGDYRYTPNNNGGYDLQEWNGSEFVTTKKNAIKGETKKVTEKETNNKTNKTTKEVTMQDAYEQTFTKAQINNYIKAMAGGKENSTYKAISNVLNKHVNGKSTKEVQDNIDEIRKSYKKAGVYEIVKKYLKNHPYVDARKFGL